MARITRVAPHLSAEELKTKLKLDPRPWCRQRWLIIYNALVDPREATDIAKHTGTTVAMVHQVVSSYNRLGIAAIETGGKGGRRRQYVTWEEEQAFLALFSHERNMGKLPRQEKSSARLKHRWGTRSTKARSRACSNGTAGANPCPVRSIRKPVPKYKSSLKKLPSQR
jgi:hypothetical protein